MLSWQKTLTVFTKFNRSTLANPLKLSPRQHKLNTKSIFRQKFSPSVPTTSVIFNGRLFWRTWILLLGGGGFGNLAVLSISSSNQVPMANLTEADKLFDDSKFDELLEFLKRQANWENEAQILWRVARCEFQLAKKIEDQKDKHAELVNTAYSHVQKSLELDDKNGLAHKWAAILLDAVSTLKGTKERVLQVLNVRTHMEKAIEYAPNDATSYYLLGEWHYSCYQVSWWERKIASIAFGKLPDADMEVALKMFEKAEEVEKDFYSKNKLMIAKTLLDLKRDKERAVALLNEVVDKYKNSDKWDDKEAVGEATKLLKQ